MRINDIRIESFGNLRDRHYKVEPGLNVFHGRNESGKTTVMEFIRSVLSPTRTRPYPARSKTDSGTLSIHDGDDTSDIHLGDPDNIPKCISDLDPNVYRSIFAMNQKGLDDIDSVSTSEIRSKFLTIPGGDSMPSVIASIDDDIKSKAGLTSRSPSEINDLQAREKQLTERIIELRSNAESYSELKIQSEELKGRLESIKASNSQSESNNALYAKVESQRKVMEDLNSLRKEREKMIKGPVATAEDVSEHDRLKSEMETRRSACESVESSMNDLINSLPNGDEPRARFHYDEIKRVLSRPKAPVKQQQVQEVRQKKLPLIPILLFIFALICLVIPGLDLKVKCLVAGVFAVIGVILLVLNKNKVIIITNNDTTDNYDAEIITLIESLGMKHTSTDHDTKRLLDIISTLDSIDRMRGKVSELKINRMQAEKEYIAFMTRFRGEQGYQDAVNAESSIRDLDSRIAALSNGIRSAGFDPDMSLPDVSYIELDTSEQEEIGKELGSISERMRNILDTKELDSLIDSSYSIAFEMDKLLHDSAVLMLSSEIIQRACSDLYSDVHPSVITTTDRYLSMMTDGRYHIDTDPRTTEITVISDDGRKGPKQWSTGLRAQIMLSLKLAIAKEMGNGEIPVILDDVLLPFDSVRKAGACRALSSVSNEMQILMFTCDDSVRDICETIEGTKVI